MREKPLLLRACEAGKLGKMHAYQGGHIAEMGFIYLCGQPNRELLREKIDGWRNRMFICRSEEWKAALLQAYPEIKLHTRWQMQPMKGVRRLPEIASPDGYEIRAFGETEFAAHPFGHGGCYADFAHFAREGAGAVAYIGGEIVASASSFLSFDGEVELDVSTGTRHRCKGLAQACAAEMMKQCARRDIAVHWDAQNPASLALAQKLGFELDGEYAAYCFVLPQNP